MLYARAIAYRSSSKEEVEWMETELPTKVTPEQEQKLAAKCTNHHKSRCKCKVKGKMASKATKG